ncbi:MAG: hypothetical protein GF403_06045 [Candidatus Coatesbacteria bacterium]|nr:hypothetical protein [Candidatus Coatesbacteria bacterium]
MKKGLLGIFGRKGGRRLRVLATTAGSVPARHKGAYIIHVAEELGAELLVLHVIEDESRWQDGDWALSLYDVKGAEINVRTLLRIGKAPQVISQVAEEEEVDVITLGLSEDNKAPLKVINELSRLTTTPILLVPTLEDF